MAKNLIKQLCCWERDVGYRQVTELQGKGRKWKGWGIWEQHSQVSRDLGRGKTWDWGYKDTPDIFLACFSCCPTNPVCPTETRRSSLKSNLPKCLQHKGNTQHLCHRALCSKSHLNACGYRSISKARWPHLYSPGPGSGLAALLSATPAPTPEAPLPCKLGK